MSQSITIIDYGMGNLRSVQKKILRCGAEAIITSDPDQISKADKLILPGVGHFANGMKNLEGRGILPALKQAVMENKTPILGICLGMQLMALKSEEGSMDGLGWFDAQVLKFKIKNKIRFKVPHMGWNTVQWKKNDKIWRGVANDELLYFVHSYYVKCNEASDILALTSYEEEFVSAVCKGNIYGMQFHPEKSHKNGEQLFRNFVNL